MRNIPSVAEQHIREDIGNIKNTDHKVKCFHQLDLYLAADLQFLDLSSDLQEIILSHIFEQE